MLLYVFDITLFHIRYVCTYLITFAFWVEICLWSLYGFGSFSNFSGIARWRKVEGHNFPPKWKAKKKSRVGVV